jgi:DNA-binding IclR family transcriptional regulator
MNAAKVQGAQSFGRAIGVLNLIADAPTPPTMAELLKRVDLTRPTLYRIVASLEAEDLIVQTADQRYVAGPRLITLAQRALEQNDIRRMARDSLESLRDSTDETVHLAVRSQSDMVYIDKIESTQAVRMTSVIGARVAMHSSSVGRAYLAALPEARCAALIDQLTLHAVTDKTLTRRAALQETVSKARALGYSYEAEENEAGVVCFGAPILDASGGPVAAVSVSVPVYRLSSDPDRYWQPLRSCCRELSRRCGFMAGP